MNIYGIGPGLSYSAAITLPIFCSLIVFLRFYTRRTRQVQLGIDDWLVLPALISLIGIGVTIIAGVALRGVGYPTTPEDENKPTTITRQVIWATYLMGTVLLTCVKISFVAWYRRLFWQGSLKWYRVTLYATAAILLIWGIAFFFSFLFLCPGHPQAYWGTLEDVRTECIITYEVYQSYATSDFVLDVVVIVLPLVPLYGLQMSVKRRLGVMCIFLLGSLTIVFSILRMITVWEVTAAQYIPGTDIPLILTRATYWGMIECGVALISCCLPTCSALLRAKNDVGSAPKYGDRMTQSSADGTRKLVGTFTYGKPVQNCSIVSCDDGTDVPNHCRPNEILMTRTFTTERTQLTPEADLRSSWSKRVTSEEG